MLPPGDRVTCDVTTIFASKGAVLQRLEDALIKREGLRPGSVLNHDLDVPKRNPQLICLQHGVPFGLDELPEERILSTIEPPLFPTLVYGYAECGTGGSIHFVQDMSDGAKESDESDPVHPEVLLSPSVFCQVECPAAIFKYDVSSHVEVVPAKLCA